MLEQENTLNTHNSELHTILTHLGIKDCAKMVSKNFITEQKTNRRDKCFDHMYRLERKPEFLVHVIACYKSWNFQYDPKTK